MNINVVSEETLCEKEIQAYVDYVKEKVSPREVTDITIKVDGDNVDLNWVLAPTPFFRIRRITGYLVGSLDKFNDAKRKEVEQRVNHDCSCA